MPFPPLLLLLIAAGGAAVLSAAGAPKRQRVRPGKKPVANLLTKTTFSAWKGDLETYVVEEAADSLVSTFGVGAAGEYPAPYRYKDALQIADIVIAAASQTNVHQGPARVHDWYETLKQGYKLIKQAPIPNWRKTYAIIATVVIPSYSGSTWWDWYRIGGKTPSKKDKFNAVLTWAAMFFALPETATASLGIDPPTSYSSVPGVFDSYLADDPAILFWMRTDEGPGSGNYVGRPAGMYPEYFIIDELMGFKVLYKWPFGFGPDVIGVSSTLEDAKNIALQHRLGMIEAGRLKRNLSPTEIRRSLYDLYGAMASWSRERIRDYDPKDSTMLADLEVQAGANMAGLAADYSLSDAPEFVIEGNLKAVNLIVWLGTARLEQEIHFEFDETAAWVGLVVQVVGSIVSAVAPLVAPSIGAIMRTAANAIQAIARAFSQGELSAAQVQALGGAAVAFLLNQAAIRLDLGDEIDALDALVGDV